MNALIDATDIREIVGCTRASRCSRSTGSAPCGAAVHPAGPRDIPLGALPARAPFADDEPRLQRVLQDYRCIGGVATGDQIVWLMRGKLDQPVSVVARWIVGRDVVSINWRNRILLPLFQFDLARCTLAPGLEQAIDELRDAFAFDDAEIAEWFASPNSWLGGARPCQRLGPDPGAVLQAARADRFVVLG